MKHLIVTSALSSLLIVALASEALGQGEVERRKLAQTGMKFLSMSVDARAAAMADATTADEGTSISLFYNPAGMASMQGSVHAAAGQARSIADIQYTISSLALRPVGGRYGTFGFSLMAVNYGEFEETIRADNERGYLDIGTYSPNAMALGLGYAIGLTDRFSVGANVKYVRQALGSSAMAIGEGSSIERENFSQTAAAFDFGTIYRTGFRSLNFAMSVRNFGREVTYVQESFEMPLTFRIGVSMDMLDFAEFSADEHSFHVSVDAVRPRDYYEQLNIGGEYVFMNTLALRAGYAFPADERALNVGVGLNAAMGGIGFGFNYAYSQFGILGDINRLGVQISL